MVQRIDHYTLLQKITELPTYSIYTAEHNTNHQIRTIYIYDLSTQPQTLSDQLENIKIMMPLLSISKSIIRFIQSFTIQQRRYIVYEYCNQGKLTQILSKNKLTHHTIINYFTQLLDIFVFLRKFKILHRSITSQNICVHDGKVKLGGFGYSKFEEDSQYFNPEILPKTILNYLSPQIFTEKKHKQKSDIYALGIVLYQMLYKRYPTCQEIKYIQQPDFQSQQNIYFHNLLSKMLIRHQYRISWEELFQFARNQDTKSQKSVYQALWDEQSEITEQIKSNIKDSVQTEKFYDESDNDQLNRKICKREELFQLTNQIQITQSIINFKPIQETHQKFYSHIPQCIWEVSYSNEKQSQNSFIFEKQMHELLSLQVQAEQQQDHQSIQKRPQKSQEYKQNLQAYEKQWQSQVKKERKQQQKTSQVRRKIHDLFHMSFDSY